MEQEILEKLDQQNIRIEQIYASVEKTRKYFLWTLIATVITFVIPLIALIFVIPYFLKSITAGLGGI